MKITEIDCHVLLADDYDPSFTSSAQDSLLVVIRTDIGLEGYGECDVNPWIGKACIEAPGTHTMGLSMKELLLGADASDIRGLWDRIYTATAMNGRRGAVVHAMGAVEMALWDIAGKHHGASVSTLLGGYRERLPTYASTFFVDEEADGLDSPEAFADYAEACLDRGYDAFKFHGHPESRPEFDVAICEDIGNAINPKLVEGQVQGAIVADVGDEAVDAGEGGVGAADHVETARIDVTEELVRLDSHLQQLQGLIAGEAEDSDGEGIYLIGVGVSEASGYHDTLMDDVTDAGKGAYIFVDSEAEAERSDQKDLVGLHRGQQPDADRGRDGGGPYPHVAGRCGSRWRRCGAV